MPDVKIIKLDKGMQAVVDNKDFNRVNVVRWYVKRRGKGECYAYRKQEINGNRINVFMHRFILDLSPTDRRMVDHVNFNGLDNRRTNMRIVTAQQSSRHCRKHIDATQSKYKGVYWEAGRGRWRAYIYLNKKKMWLGRYIDEGRAASAYNNKAKELFGEYAVLNNI